MTKNGQKLTMDTGSESINKNLVYSQKSLLINPEDEAPDEQTISKIQAVMENMTEYHTTTPVFSHFSDGLYIREWHAFKDTLVVSKRHRNATCGMLLSGCMSVYDGIKVARYMAPALFMGRAGKRRIIYCHENIIFTTIHPTTDTDIDVLEDQLIITHEEYVAGLQAARRVNK